MLRFGIRTKKNSKDAKPQVVAVAVDSDKNSQHALKWAADHAIPKGQLFFLIHVRKDITTIPTPTGQKLHISEVNEDVASAFIEQINTQTRELLLPFQCFCSRRALQCKEVILEDSDIPNAIINFVVLQSVDKLILGSSSRNAFTRTFKQADVPTSVLKLVPEFCSVYVISKGRVSFTRPAPTPNTHPGQLIPKLEVARNTFQSAKTEPIQTHHNEEVARSQPLGNSRIPHDPERGIYTGSNENLMSGNFNIISQTGGHLGYSNYSMSSCPSPSRMSNDRSNMIVARQHLNGMSQPSRLTSTLNRHHQDPNRSCEEHWLKGSGFSGRSQLGAKELGGASSSSHSQPQAQEPHPWRVREERRSEPTRFSREAATGMTEENHWSRTSVNRQNQERIFLLEAKQVLDSLPKEIPFRRYDIKELEKATSNFSEKLKIGEGGYGPVFRGNLDDTLVAIKILRGDASQGMKQFQQEVEVLSGIRHPNMVLLMGACADYGCLVYEYMANGSLEDCLLCRNTPPLSWQLRFKIATEIATGLLFLHETKPEPLVHRDLKPANILLDHNFLSKIADVGLARLVPASVADAVTQYRQTAAAGTFCYIDPEYLQTGMVGIKSDIYALGIILLQLVTAQPPMGLAHNVGKAINEGRFEEMLDLSVRDWPMEEALKLAKLALKCAELRRKDRPDLGTVVIPELMWLKEFADQVQPSPMFSQHGYASRYQEDLRNPSMEGFGFLDDRMERDYSMFSGESDLSSFML